MARGQAERSITATHSARPQTPLPGRSHVLDLTTMEFKSFVAQKHVIFGGEVSLGPFAKPRCGWERVRIATGAGPGERARLHDSVPLLATPGRRDHQALAADAEASGPVSRSEFQSVSLEASLPFLEDVNRARWRLIFCVPNLP
jgi:hypothetical protein